MRVDVTSLEMMGILDEVRELLSVVDLWDYDLMSAQSYDRLTVEFLNSFDPWPCNHPLREGDESTHPSGPPNDTPFVNFRLNNVHCTSTKIEMQDMFGWQSTDYKPPSSSHPRYDKHRFWETLTSIPQFDPDTAYATQIHNPSIRMDFKIMAWTFFARDLEMDLV